MGDTLPPLLLTSSGLYALQLSHIRSMHLSRGCKQRVKRRRVTNAEPFTPLRKPLFRHLSGDMLVHLSFSSHGPQNGRLLPNPFEETVHMLRSATEATFPGLGNNMTLFQNGAILAIAHYYI